MIHPVEMPTFTPYLLKRLALPVKRLLAIPLHLVVFVPLFRLGLPS